MQQLNGEVGREEVVAIFIVKYGTMSDIPSCWIEMYQYFTVDVNKGPALKNQCPNWDVGQHDYLPGTQCLYLSHIARFVYT